MQRHGRGGGTAASAPLPLVRVAGFALLIAHLAVVGWLSVRPVSVLWVEPANLHPFATIHADLASGTPRALGGLLRGLLLLAPLGVLLPLAGGRLRHPLPCTWARTVSAGALLSSGLVLLRSGVPGHTVDVDTVLLNTAGVAASCALVFPLVRAGLLRGLQRRTGGGQRSGRGTGADIGTSTGTRTGAGGGAGPGVRHRDAVAQGSTPKTPRVGVTP